jgi:uncharacterized protein (TIGR02231 family)
MRRLMITVVLAAMCAPAVTHAAQVTTGEVAEVTAYRDKALVTRVVKVEGAQGLMELVVSDLPEHVIPATLAAEARGNSTVHSVTYRTRAVSGSDRPEVRDLDDKIAAMRKQLKEIEAYEQLLKKKEGIITNLETFTASTEKTELQQGVLKFQELKQLTDYGLTKHQEYVKEGLDLQDRRTAAEKQLGLLERGRAEVTKSYSREQREALVHLTKDSAQPTTVTLRSLVNNVSWSPQYNLRAAEARDSVRVAYNALVRQMSGEDWTGAQLTLSTAQPSFSAEPPLLEPLTVILGAVQVLEEQAVRDLIAANVRQRTSKQVAVQQRPQVQADLNAYAGQLQLLEWTQREAAIKAGRRGARRVEGVSATYKLPQPVSLASRTDEQILQIATAEVSCRFHHMAAPVLTDFVYEEAAATNTSSYVFLPGLYDSYLNGEFVGKGELELIAGGEEFKAGFGVDPQVQVTKELVSKTERTEGGNRVSEYEYKLKIANFRDKGIALRLVDRIPYSERSSIKVQLLEGKSELSKDAQYRDTGYKKGLLRWDLSVPASAVNDKSMAVTYKFSVAHERGKAISGLTAPGQQ